MRNSVRFFNTKMKSNYRELSKYTLYSYIQTVTGVTYFRIVNKLSFNVE